MRKIPAFGLYDSLLDQSFDDILCRMPEVRTVLGKKQSGQSCPFPLILATVSAIAFPAWKK